MKSKNVLYNRSSNIILSELYTKVYDDIDNIYNFLEGFVFDTYNEVISSKTTNIIDNENNSYTFENVKINLISKNLAGKEVNVEFRDNFFGIENNDPLLKGRSATSDENKTVINMPTRTSSRNLSIDELKQRVLDLESENNHLHIQLRYH